MGATACGMAIEKGTHEWTGGENPGIGGTSLEQEYITPYTPEQNGMIERFFLTLKQECVWLHRFESRDQAFRVVADWLDRYDTDRPHSALGYLTPQAYRANLAA